MLTEHLFKIYLLTLTSIESILHPLDTLNTPYDLNRSTHSNSTHINLSQACQQNSKDTWHRFIHNEHSLQDDATLKYIGKGLNDLGYYSSCLATPNMTYYLVQAGIDYLRFNLGLCVPDACSVGDWKQISDAVNEKIWDTASTPGSFMNTSGEFFSLNITNVPESKKSPEFGQDIYFSLLISFVGLVTILVLYYTIKTILGPFGTVNTSHILPEPSQSEFISGSRSEFSSTSTKQKMSHFKVDLSDDLYSSGQSPSLQQSDL